MVYVYTRDDRRLYMSTDIHVCVYIHVHIYVYTHMGLGPCGRYVFAHCMLKYVDFLFGKSVFFTPARQATHDSTFGEVCCGKMQDSLSLSLSISLYLSLLYSFYIGSGGVATPWGN